MVNAFPVQRAHAPGLRAKTYLVTGVADKPALERCPKILRPRNRPSRQPTSIKRPQNRLDTSPVDLYRGYSPPPKLLGDDQLTKRPRRPGKKHAPGKTTKCAAMTISPQKHRAPVAQSHSPQSLPSLKPGGPIAVGGIIPTARGEHALLVATQNQPATAPVVNFFEAWRNFPPGPIRGDHSGNDAIAASN